MIYAALFVASIAAGVLPDPVATTVGVAQRSLVRGVDALAFDPGAATSVDGLELKLRQHWVEGTNDWGRFAVYGAFPLS